MPETTTTDEVRHLIAVSGIPYTQIADGSGVSPATISRIVNGSGANADSIERLTAFLSPLVNNAAPADSPQPGVISRDALMVILRQHQEQTTILKRIARQRLRWIIILAVALVAAIAWFLWDLTHPEAGLIRLKQAGYIIGHLIGLAGR